MWDCLLWRRGAAIRSADTSAKARRSSSSCTSPASEPPSPQPLTPQPWPCPFAVPAPAQRCRPRCAPSASRRSRPRQAARRTDSTTMSGSPGAAAVLRTRGRMLTLAQDRKAHLDRVRWTILARRCAVARNHTRTRTLTHTCRLHSDRIRSDRLPGTIHCQQARCVAF